MKRMLALFSLALMACHTSPDDGAGPGPHPLGAIPPESWTEKPPEDIVYFAGCRLDTLTAHRPFGTAVGEAGFSMVQKCWTDAIACVLVDGNRVCEPGVWFRRFSGTFRKEDSSLAFTWRFESSAPENAPARFGADSGEAVFKLKQIEWDSRLVMERVDSGAGPWGKNLELTRLR